MNYEEKNWARDLAKGLISVNQLRDKKVINEMIKIKLPL